MKDGVRKIKKPSRKCWFIRFTVLKSRQIPISHRMTIRMECLFIGIFISSTRDVSAIKDCSQPVAWWLWGFIWIMIRCMTEVIVIWLACPGVRTICFIRPDLRYRVIWLARMSLNGIIMWHGLLLEKNTIPMRHCVIIFIVTDSVRSLVVTKGIRWEVSGIILQSRKWPGIKVTLYMVGWITGF